MTNKKADAMLLSAVEAERVKQTYILDDGSSSSAFPRSVLCPLSQKDDPMSVSEEDSKRVPILRPDTAVYYRRWYTLLIFSLNSFIQASCWNTWGPITDSAEAVLGWEDSDIGNMANFGNIAALISVIPMTYFMDVKGMRLSMILATFLIAVGTAIRCFTLEHKIVTWIAALSAVLTSAGGVVSFGGPALISSLWFPLDQRATATGIASFANYFGISMSFIIGPLIVRSPKYGTTNHSRPSNYSVPGYFYGTGNDSIRTDIINMDAMKTDIFHLMYYYTAFSCTIFVLVVIYFPSKPPLPPSVSASKGRVEYLQGLKQLARNGSLWLIVIACALTNGILAVWGSILVVILKPLSISQTVVGYIGFWQTLAGCLASVVIARFSDIFMKRMKLFLIISFIGAIGATSWFILICQQFIPYDIVSLYASAIGIGVFINGGIPLFYELICEESYPVSEGISGGFLTLVCNASGIIFLLIMLIPDIGNAWQNWALLGSVIIAVPMLCLFPERYHRTDLDLRKLDMEVTVNEQECSRDI